MLRLILRRAGWLVGLGLAAGLAGAFGLMRMMANLLYGVSTTAPVTIVAVLLLLAGVALFASYVPARRAARVDPMVALRCE